MMMSVDGGSCVVVAVAVAVVAVAVVLVMMMVSSLCSIWIGPSN